MVVHNRFLLYMSRCLDTLLKQWLSNFQSCANFIFYWLHTVLLYFSTVPLLSGTAVNKKVGKSPYQVLKSVTFPRTDRIQKLLNNVLVEADISDRKFPLSIMCFLLLLKTIIIVFPIKCLTTISNLTLKVLNFLDMNCNT